MKRAFASLTPPEALQIAVSIEQRNAGIYQHLSELFDEFGDADSLEISGVFAEMAAEERGHSTLLQERYRNLYASSVASLSEEDLLEFIEVPDIAVADLFPPNPLPTGEAASRALRIALDAELAAQAFYRRLAENTVAGPLQRLYAELASMEDGHVGLIRQRLLVPGVCGGTVN